MKSIKTPYSRRFVLLLLAIPLVAFGLLFAAVTIMTNSHLNHDKERDRMQASYREITLPSSLTLTSSQWMDASAPPEDPQNYSWDYVYASKLSRADQYRELKEAFKTQGLEKPKEYGDITNSVLYGLDRKRHLQLIATFMPQPDHENSTEPLQAVVIAVYPL